MEKSSGWTGAELLPVKLNTVLRRTIEQGQCKKEGFGSANLAGLHIEVSKLPVGKLSCSVSPADDSPCID
jgi:hypothetical protein